ncbi:PhoH family protein [Planctopirus limnophila DSM 3776]|uniref:PhoH-like protein n=1 Tax=Planctopirus limnophila (strain ATCC 43296 / DSM 3776 / IFAM 1008 / Mu 290) TaxID=521674 RepID=D5SNE4_PLAL2|nr:PhoH family protein [Planctopirus limnophila]ADG68058.1 PhoH family protein [Planctopirus limnophila DSM 3776]
MTDRKIAFQNHEHLKLLFGPNDRNLRKLREKLRIEVVFRGDEIRLSGPSEQVDLGSDIIGELRGTIERRGMLSDEEFERVLNRRNAEAMLGAESSIDVFHKAKKVFPMGQGQAAYIEAIRQHDLVFCSGPAGSGKTYLAVAMAVNALRNEQVRKIVLVRPAVEAGEKLGFLPGDMLEKVNPYLRPLLDALGDILDFDTVQRYLDRDVIEIAPLAFMRGRTLNNTFIILDEAQNTTTVQMKMFLTRMGQRSKIVVTGDATQIDLPDNVTSGLADAVQRLRNVEGISVIELSGGDIVRHPLVRRIVAAYDTGKSNDFRPRTQFEAKRTPNPIAGSALTEAQTANNSPPDPKDSTAVQE